MNASNDPSQIRAWWSKWPEANIAWVPGRSGHIVLDVDGEIGAQSARALGLRDTGTACVKTGRGYHYIFDHPGGNIGNKKLADGIDVRADAGYAILPPSQHSSGVRYGWFVPFEHTQPLPEHVRDLLSEERALTPVTGPPRSQNARPLHADVPEGERNNTLATSAGSFFAQGLGEEQVLALCLLENDAWSKPLSHEEVRNVVRSIGKLHASRGDEDAEASLAVVPPPAPLGSQAYYGLVGEVVRAIQNDTEAHPAGLLVQILVAFGNAVGHRPHMQVGADLHRLNEFVLLVGTTGKGRKGMSWGFSKAVLMTADSEWVTHNIAGGLSTGEGLIHRIRDESIVVKPKRGGAGTKQVVDPGVPDKRVLVFESEFASPLRILEREGNTLSALVRQAWDGDTLSVLTKHSPSRATNPHVSIIGHVTQEELVRRVRQTEISNGFINRFLLIYVDRANILPFGGRPVAEVLGTLPERVAESMEAARKVGEVHMDPGARQLWEEVYPDLSEGKPGLVGGATNRAEAHVLRFALLLALMNRETEISVGALRASLEIWRYAEETAVWVFGDSPGDPLSERLLTALESAGERGMTQTELRDSFGHHSNSGWQKALRVLARTGQVKSSKESTGGRSATRWWIANATLKGGKGGNGSNEEGEAA